uniref:AMP-binding domain-containing protein n=1 Tax=Syphacia muris TaxID=451379 RepID=A0A0N5AR61_9BILA
MGSQQNLAGLVCSDANLVERFVSIIGAIQKFRLRALWCPDTEKSIHLAANFDIPSVSHTAYQLMCRSDTSTVIVAGHPCHNVVYCLQAQALKKVVICIGCLALSLQSANALDRFTERLGLSPITIVYPIKYTKPLCLIRENLERIGVMQCIKVEYYFKLSTNNNDRLLYDAKTVLHMYGHELIDTVASISKTPPKHHAINCLCKTSVVEHFRLKELDSAYMQVEFDNVIANIRLVSGSTEFLSVHVCGTLATLELNLHSLKLISNDQCLTLWQGNGLFESLFRDGLYNALSFNGAVETLDESTLVKCFI